MKLSPIVSSVGLSVILAQSFASASSESQVHVDNLLKWVDGQKGAFFSNKQEIRRGDDGEHEGVFATERIEKGEVLFSLPWSIIITAFGEGGEPSADPEPVPLNCDLVRNLISEIQKGKESTYYEYVQYLMDLPEGDLPSSWSDGGVEFLTEVVGDLPPTDLFSWLEDDWYNSCGGGHSPFEERIALMVVQNADDDLMIPLFDMYNHRNAPWHNADGESVRGVKYDLIATKPIEAGQPIHTSYNLCAGCGGRDTVYGTPELFRDYGFIEDFPQRWAFHDRKFRIDISKEEETGTVKVSFYDLNKNYFFPKLDVHQVKFLRKQVQRLERVGNLQWSDERENAIPEKELKLTWALHAAFLDAIKTALISHFDGDYEKACLDGNVVDGVCVVGDTYEDLEDDKDTTNYSTNSCDIHTFMQFEGYDLTFVRQTHYQLMNYQVRRSDQNVCMDLDDTIQICSNYRPHYHEYIVDYPAKYVDNVKRVIFIGGGDSMILDEVLKYPELELVVGLEIDQQVTRHVFKRMHTQPHFDDDRVEWWFGDATKSLLLLPEDYAASFDMVLVDLSETVTSLTVTDELDVLEALSLYLKPDGVMVKNEFYHNKMSEIFDYTAEIHVNDVPLICAQSMILGSNKKDFFHLPPKDHGIEMKLLDPIVEDLDRLKLVHDYRRNNATEQGKCKLRPQPELVDQTKAAGQLMVIDAEQVTIDLSSTATVQDAVIKAVEEVGLTPVDGAAKATTDNAFIIPLKEGYVMARLWKEDNYVAFDAHLWGAFNKFEALRAALIALSGSPKGSHPNYRIVVGGMFGYPEWKQDQSTMGPQMNAMSRNCDIAAEEAKEIKSIDKDTIDKALSHTIEKMLWAEDGVALVLCGSKDEPCTSREVMMQREEINEVVTLYSCDGLDTTGPVEVRSASMYACEKSMTKHLLAEVDESAITALIIDDNATGETAKIIFSIMSSPKNRNALLSRHYIGISFMDDKAEIWRRGLLEKMRRDDHNDPSSRAQVKLFDGDSSVELGILSIGDKESTLHLGDLIATMKETVGLDAEADKLQGGKWQWQDKYNPREYLPGDYDPSEALQQYEEQKPLGRHSVFQLEAKSDDVVVSAVMLAGALNSAVSKAGTEIRDALPQTDDNMEGCIVASLYESGSVVVVWDGRKHVDLSVFSYDQDEEKSTNFVNAFLEASSGNLMLTLRDDQPRGIGRVVNFQADIDHVDAPIILDNDNDDDDDDDEDDN